MNSLAFKIALNSYFCCSSHVNLLNPGNNKLASNLLEALTKSNGSPTSISWSLSYGPILGPDPVPTSVKYIDEDLPRATKLALEFFFQG